MECHQILVGAAPGDAITGEALLLQRELHTRGRSEIFAQHRDPEMLDRVHHIGEYDRVVGPAASPKAVLLLHASISEPAVFDFVMSRSERLVVRYHNITPAHFFAPYDAHFAALLARGREELAALRSRAVLALADSRFNESELQTLGYVQTAVVPLVMDLDALLTAPSVDLAARGVTAGGGAPLLLFVGRVAPNKGHRACLEVLHVLQTYHQPEARVVFAGGGEVPAYRATLNRGADELGLRCTFAGKVSTAELATLYRRADAFLSMSEHEGFGAPLVEAMAFGLPVIAWDTTAVGETTGDAAVLLSDASPAVAAEAVCRVTSDADVRGAMRQRGRDRARGLRPDVVVPQLLDHLLAVA